MLFVCFRYYAVAVVNYKLDQNKPGHHAVEMYASRGVARILHWGTEAERSEQPVPEYI